MRLLKFLHQFIFSTLRIVTRAEFTQRNTEFEARYTALEKRLKLIQSIHDGLVFTTRKTRMRVNDLSKNEWIPTGEPHIVSPMTFKQQLDTLKQLEPNAFEVWWQCFLNGERAYQETSEGNLSDESHPVAQAFRDFISPYFAGNILDVGCGPLFLPTYINIDATKNNVRLYGIDPLPAKHPFEFYHGFAEFLPWQDNCFDTLVVATSLDHCLSLNRTLSEIRRVLKPGGFLLVWVGFIPGSKEYQPKSENCVAVDEYHLFHFDRPWFESLLENSFSVISHFAVDEVSSFYAFVK